MLTPSEATDGRLYQIRTLDRQRLIKRIGTLTDRTLKDQIIEALEFQLGMW